MAKHFSPTQDRESGPSAELRLVRAILAQAIEDLFGSCIDLGRTNKDHMREQALTFLTADGGQHAKHRNDLCELAGFDGDVLRSRIIATLEGQLSADFILEGKGRRDLKGIAEARAMWASKQASAAQAEATWLARRTADAEKRKAEADHRDHVARQTAAASAELEARLAKAIAQDPKVQQATALVRALANGPLTVRELGIVSAMDTEAIRWRMTRVEEAGLVQKVGRTWMLAAPKTAGALPDPVVEQPAA
ncbi:MAG: hypothetical protein IH625_14165 [Rhodobacteraceae bacterium]|nr:hypothetical protein [Paracoccaceae bacterium]